MSRIIWGSGECPGCSHFWSQHRSAQEPASAGCHGHPDCPCTLVRMSALVPVEQLSGPAPTVYRDEGDMLPTLDALAVAARDLFESLRRATDLALREQQPGECPAGPTGECRHCGRALRPVVHTSSMGRLELEWGTADGGISCGGQGNPGPGAFYMHEPVPVLEGTHRCPHCQRVHAYPRPEPPAPPAPPVRCLTSCGCDGRIVASECSATMPSCSRCRR